MLNGVEEDRVYVLHRYQEFMVLFGENERRAALLNALGSAFVHSLQVELSSALILGLCRLTDKCKDSVSVCHLPGFICGRPHFKKQVQEHVSKENKHAQAAKIQRDKWIAHRDKVRPDTTVRYRDIKAELNAVRGAVNAVTMGHCETCIPKEVINRQMSTARYAVCIGSLVEGVLYIESRIDPTGETGPFDDKVAVAFLNTIGGDPSKDRDKTWSLRMTAKTIKEGLDSQP